MEQSTPNDEGESQALESIKTTEMCKLLTSSDIATTKQQPGDLVFSIFGAASGLKTKIKTVNKQVSKEN